MWRPDEFRDPETLLERAQSGTCKGCPHERPQRFFGEDRYTCSLGKRYGDKCENYGKRVTMAIFENSVAPQDDIDSVLLDWYEWSQAYEPNIGYRGSDASCREYRSSRQWMTYDELGEVVDRNLQAEIGKVVEPIVMALGVRHRIAVTTAMRNMVTGSAVWRNPRHPETQASDYAEAKDMMRPKLYSKGLLKKLVNPIRMA